MIVKATHIPSDSCPPNIRTPPVEADMIEYRTNESDGSVKNAFTLYIVIFERVNVRKIRAEKNC
jgi:hypothetical protein